MAKAKSRVRLVLDIEHDEDMSIKVQLERMLILYHSAPAPNAAVITIHGNPLVISSRVRK